MDKILNWIYQTFRVCLYEFRAILKDSGVAIILIGATIIYPVLYSAIYNNENLVDVPIGVVDECNTEESRELVRRLDASPDLRMAEHAVNMTQAQDMLNARKIHGIVLIPSDFSNNLAIKEQAFVSTYCDMSSFLYYRAMALGSNYAVLDFSDDIQIQRLAAAGITGESAVASVAPIPDEKVVLFNEQAGFFTFFLPAILILILHQTLVFGMAMRSGQAREDGRSRRLLPPNSSAQRVVQVVIGTALCYFAIYAVISAYVLGIVPRLFSLPHLGNTIDLVWFMLPFLLALIFFAITISSFVRNREVALFTLLFFSVILLFMSGFSWPQSNIRGFWRVFSSVFPSTHGIQGYIKINSMGATLGQVSTEYISLWIQAGVYFIAACFAKVPRRALK